MCFFYPLKIRIRFFKNKKLQFIFVLFNKSFETINDIPSLLFIVLNIRVYALAVNIRNIILVAPMRLPSMHLSTFSISHS